MMAGFYSSAKWRKLSAACLDRDPVCQHCTQRPSVVADHAIARKDGGPDTLANLRGLCRTCHSKRTAKWGGGFGNPRVGFVDDEFELNKLQAAALRRSGLTLNPVIAAHRAGWQFKFAESQVARLAPGYFLYRAIIFCERPDGSRAALWPPRNGGPRKRSTFPIGEPWHRNAAGNHSNRKLQTHSARKIAFYLNAIGRDALAWERDEAGGETGKTRGAART